MGLDSPVALPASEQKVDEHNRAHHCQASKNDAQKNCIAADWRRQDSQEGSGRSWAGQGRGRGRTSPRSQVGTGFDQVPSAWHKLADSPTKL